MAKNTLSNAVKLLSLEDLDKFEKYLDSPYFNSRKQFLKAFRYLRTSANADKNEKGKLYSILFPGKKYNDTNFRKAVSDLNRLFEDFMGHTGIDDKDKGLKYVRMMEMMQEKGLLDSFNSAYKIFIKRSGKNNHLDDSFYQDMYRAEILNFYDCYNKSVERAAKSLEKASKNLNLMYVFSKLHLYRDILVFETTTGTEINRGNSFFEDSLKYVESNSSEICKEHPSLYIIYLVVKMTKDADGDRYAAELNNYLIKFLGKLGRQDLTNANNYLVSYYWVKINKGQVKYFRELIKLYKYAETHGFLKFDRYFPHHIVNSIVMAGINMQEFSWLEYFLEKYREDIEPGYADDVYNLSMAKLDFARGRLNETLKKLNKVNFRDTLHFINAKILLLKTLYETGDTDSSRYIIDSLKHYISRNRKLNVLQVQSQKNFIKFYLILLQIKSGKKISYQKVVDMMDETQGFIPNRQWLLEKTEQYYAGSSIIKPF